VRSRWEPESGGVMKGTKRESERRPTDGTKNFYIEDPDGTIVSSKRPTRPAPESGHHRKQRHHRDGLQS
jgi:hypothetical protein